MSVSGGMMHDDDDDDDDLRAPEDGEGIESGGYQDDRRRYRYMAAVLGRIGVMTTTIPWGI